MFHNIINLFIIWIKNQDNKNNKDLCIFTQINGNHFNLLYDKNITVLKIYIIN